MIPWLLMNISFLWYKGRIWALSEDRIEGRRCLKDGKTRDWEGNP